MEKIVVMIVDKQALFRVGACHALSQQADFEVFDSAPDENLLALIEASSPNVLLLDIDYPYFKGLELAPQIALHSPTTKIIMLAFNTDDKQIFEIIKTGAVAYLDKSVTAEGLIKAVRQVSQGEYPINDSVLARPKVAIHVLRQFQSMHCNNGKSVENIIAPLTSREKQVLNYIAEGNSNKQIASILRLFSNSSENPYTKVANRRQSHYT